jgi:hypothetical protein
MGLYRCSCGGRAPRQCPRNTECPFPLSHVNRCDPQVVFPWAIALLFYAGNLLNQLITWSSALLFVYLNLMLPLMVYVARQVRQ